MIWQPELPDLKLSKKTGAVQTVDNEVAVGDFMSLEKTMQTPPGVRY